MAFCAYLITGQLLAVDVGSVTMWALPKGAGNKSMNENFLQVLLRICHIHTTASFFLIPL